MIPNYSGAADFIETTRPKIFEYSKPGDMIKFE